MLDATLEFGFDGVVPFYFHRLELIEGLHCKKWCRRIHCEAMLPSIC